MKRWFKNLLRISAVALLVLSSLALPAQSVYAAADVNIEASAGSFLHAGSNRGGIYWSTNETGYIVFLDNSYNLVYRKTSDSGVTWSSQVEVSNSTVLQYDCWADWQTPGDTGSKINIAYIDTTNDDIRYAYIDTSDDSDAQGFISFAGGDGEIYDTLGFGDFCISITKAVGGNYDVVYMHRDNSSAYDYQFYTSPDGSIWTQESSPWEGDTDDFIRLFSGNEVDTNDIWAAFWDDDASELSLKTYDDSADNWTEQLIGSVVHSALYADNNLDGQIRLSDRHLILAAWDGVYTSPCDLKVWDINGASNITAKTNVLSGVDENAMISVFINQVNNDIYISYLGGTDYSTEVKCISQNSTDGGVSWSGNQTTQVDAEDDERWVSSGSMKTGASGGWFMPVWFNDDLNDLFCNTSTAVYIEGSGGYSPTVVTVNASSVTPISATGNGNITDTGNATIIERGFQYGIGSFTDSENETGSFGSGNFSLTISGLSANTEYQYRAYAVNSENTSYGSTVNFTTPNYSQPIFTTINATMILDTSAIFNGSITNLTLVDADDILWQWGTSTGNYTDNHTDTANSSNGLVAYSVSGLAASTQYFYRGAARINGQAWQYGSELNFTTQAAADIDVGTANLSGSSTYASGYTYVNVDNPVNKDGYLTNLYIGISTNLTDLWCGTVYDDSGNLTVRDDYFIATTTETGNQTYNIVLKGKTGDYIAVSFRDGDIVKQVGGAGGVMYTANNTLWTGQTFAYSTDASNQAAFYASGTSNNSFMQGGQITVIADETDKDNYGLKYPLTYEFYLPDSSSNLTGNMRYGSGSWQELTGNTSSDLYSGIDCVRFDYDNDRAYVNVAFGDSSDNISIKITNSSNNTVSTLYKGIPVYYDNNKNVFISSHDDYGRSDGWADDFIEMINLHQQFGVVATVSVQTATCTAANWTSLQTEYEQGYVEIASHSSTHPMSLPYIDVDYQVSGSLQDIKDNMTLSGYQSHNGTELVPAWIEPQGVTDDEIRAACAAANYISDREYNDSDDTLASWNATVGIYNTINPTHTIIDSSNVTYQQALIDAAFNNRVAYHLMTHPYVVSWGINETGGMIFGYAGNRTDVWYVGFGALYLYDYPRSVSGVILAYETTDAAVATIPSVTTVNASSLTCNSATGNGNITDTGNATVTERGIQYGIGAFTDSENATGTFTTGNFSFPISGLLPNTEYQTRAYAVNSEGTGYGSTVNFTTSNSSNPTVTTVAASSITTTTAQLNLLISGLDCADADNIYYQWGTATGNYTANYTETSNQSNGVNLHGISGLLPGTTYYFRGGADITGGAIQWGSELSFTTSSGTADFLMQTVLPSLIACAIIISSVLFLNKDPRLMFTGVVIGILAFYIVQQMLN